MGNFFVMAEVNVRVGGLDEFITMQPEVLKIVGGDMGRNLFGRTCNEDLMSFFKEETGMRVHIRRKLVVAEKNVAGGFGITQVANVIKELTLTNRSITSKFKPTNEEPRSIGFNT